MRRCSYLGLTYRMLRGMFGPDASVGKDGRSKKGLARRASKQKRISFNDVAGIDSARKELGASLVASHLVSSECMLSVE